MFYLLAILVFLISSETNPVSGANILGLMAMPSPSHHIWNSVLMHRLAEVGHNVTVLSVDIPKPTEKLPPNLHYIHLEEGYSMYTDDRKLDLNAFIGIGPIESIPMFWDFAVSSTISVVKSKGLRVLLNYPDDFKFDLIVHDYTMGPLLLGFVHKFKYPPLVGISAFHNPPITMDSMSNHYFPAYVPYYSTSYAAEMTFCQRLHNTLIFIAETAYRRLVYLPKIDAILRPHFAKDTPYLGDLSKHTAISLVNSHPVISYVESVPPNVIEVGGMQIMDPKPLPRDLEEYMNNTKNGVIFVSFGTNMRSEFFTETQVRIILNAMAQLSEYDFMWKFDEKYLKEKVPENVLIRPFFPQRDILAHPNLKAFVTHCGGLSTHEAIWRGVPMVGVPLFVDQHRNLRQAMKAGVAEKIDFLTMSTDVLRDTIKRVLQDPKYAANAKVIATQFRDRPAKPLDTAVWWVEYLLRNPNPYHLKSPAAKLNIFQANSLDCLLVVWTGLVVLAWLTVKLLAFAWRTFRKTTNATKLKRN